MTMMEDLYENIKILSHKHTVPAGAVDFYDISDVIVQLAKARTFFTRHYAWCIPDRNMISALTHFLEDKTVLSVGAGNGLVEHLLQQSGVDVIATDRKDKRN